MKTYVIRDKDRDIPNEIGYLFCYEKAEEYIIELCDDLDEWEAPLLFQKFVREKKYTIPRDAAKMWVRERVVPSGRQNIGAILKQEKLNEYNEMKLLVLGRGKSSQDNCYIEKISYDDIPECIKQRSNKNIEECFVSSNENIVCLFKDNTVKKVSLEKLQKTYKELLYIRRRKLEEQRLEISAGGYSISIDNSVDIFVEDLRSPLYEETIIAEDFRLFATRNIVDTTEACERLSCTRQNLSYLIKSGQIKPLMGTSKENLFTVGSVERLNQE